MIATNNKTLYMLGGKNDFEKAALYTYSTFYLLAALAGNSVILLATSRRYEAIKLDRVTVTIIQHIAFCDVGNVFFSYIPGFISFIYGRWVLGRVLCWVRVYIGALFALTGSLLVCGLNVSKLSILLNPLGTRHVPTTTAKCHLVVGFLWLVSAIWPVSQLVVEPVNFYFDYRIMICMYAYSASVWKWLGPLCLTVVIILPSIIAIFTTLWILVIARKQVSKRNKQYKESLQWQSILTVVLIATVYCVSFLPHAVYYIFSLADPNFIAKKEFLPLASGEVLFQEYGVDGLPMQGFVYDRFSSFGNFMLTINNFSNFFVYYFSIASFRKFLNCKVRGLCMKSHRDGVMTHSSDSRLTSKINVAAHKKEPYRCGGSYNTSST